MQFPFKLPPVLQLDRPSNILALNGITLGKTLKHLKPEHIKQLSEILNRMGQASSTAQNLKQVITSFEKFIGSDNRIYLRVEGDRVLGMLKVGERNLFYRDYIGNIKEIRPTCVLDFYVHESCQRSGVGKDIFLYFLKVQNKSPEKIAYDRPSEKLLGFLRKHFGLAKYIPQNNNYVIFNAYFDSSFKELVPSLKETQEVAKKETKTSEFFKEGKQKAIKEIKETKEIMNTNMNSTSLTKKTSLTTDSDFGLRTSKNTLLPNPTKKDYELVSPWAIVGQGSHHHQHFRTTSNSYGDHYSLRKR